MAPLFEKYDSTPRIEVVRVGSWGPMTWSGRLILGLSERGSWYAWTERGIERKMRRVLARHVRDEERRATTRKTIEAR